MEELHLFRCNNGWNTKKSNHPKTPNLKLAIEMWAWYLPISNCVEQVLVLAIHWDLESWNNQGAKKTQNQIQRFSALLLTLKSFCQDNENDQFQELESITAKFSHNIDDICRNTRSIKGQAKGTSLVSPQSVTGSPKGLLSTGTHICKF
jgi:hypothetical protein